MIDLRNLFYYFISRDLCLILIPGSSSGKNHLSRCLSIVSVSRPWAGTKMPTDASLCISPVFGPRRRDGPGELPLTKRGRERKGEFPRELFEGHAVTTVLSLLKSSVERCGRPSI